jgi:predicted transcriptional regulator of viral defense system
MEAENWIVKVLTQAEHHELAAREVFELGRDEPFTLPMLKAAAASLEKKGLITRTGGKYSVYWLVQQSLWDGPEET